MAGRYELITQLGAGGMAVVHRALDRQRGVYCAVKMLLPRYLSRGKIVKRFAAEAKTMMRIDHRNVLRVTDVGFHGAIPYFVMDLAEGGSLGDWLEHHNRPMPPRMALEVAIQICKGVGAAHAVGVVHRDLKPDNVLLTRRGVCKVADFGIARIDDERLRFTAVGAEMGTVGYMAPEQRDDAAGVDVRADVYAIGATLYTLLTHRVSADLFVADRHRNLLDGVPEPLVPVLLTATSYLRDQRYETVGDLARALFDARAELPPDPVDAPALVLPLAVVRGADFDPARPHVTYELDTDEEPSLGLQIPEPAREIFAEVAGVSVTPPPTRREVSVLPAPRREELSATPSTDPEARTGSIPPEPSTLSERPPDTTLAERSRDEEVDVSKIEAAGRVARWAALAIALVAVPAALWGSAQGIRSAELATIRAEAACAAAMGRERPILDTVRALGVRDRALEDLADAERAARGGPRWEPAVTSYLERLEAVVQEASAENQADPRALEIRERYDRMASAWDGYRDAVTEWDHAAQRFPASLTVSLGIARAPASVPAETR